MEQYDNKLIEAVGYLRLSRDDGDEESSSITNQRAIISDWARNNGFIITDWYVDDGYSGYSMDRPEFNRLKKDLNDNKINIVVAKNLSRIGRHNSKVNLFLEQINEDGKRVIAIGDDYDTLDERSHEMVGIRTWINEKYVKDTSKNIRAAIEKMQKDGRFICQVPYGYVLDPFTKGKYYVDKECATYVQEIFDMYLNGYGSKAIAKILTERHIPTYWQNVKTRMERRGQVYQGREFSGVWSPSNILKMLKNDFYIGTLTLAKSKRRSINGKKIKQSDDKLIRFEDAHEPLIDKQTFKLVQEIIAERTRSNYRGSKKDNPNLFSGKLFCADCGTRLTPGSSAITQRYVCRKYHIMGTDYCSSHSTNDLNLTAALMYFLEHCRENLSEAISDLKINNHDNINCSKDGLQILQKDKERLEQEISVLIEQKMREIIANPAMKEMIDKTYADIINSKYASISSVTSRIEEMFSENMSQTEMEKELKSVLNIFDEIISRRQLSRRQVETIVDKIIVHEDDGLDIYLKGDLHELCTNYIQFKHSKKEEIIKQIIKYAETHSDGVIIKNKCIAYVRAQGVRFDTNVFSILYNNLIKEGYLTRTSPHGGCRVEDVDKLRNALKNDTVMEYTSRCRKLSVNIELLKRICNWNQSITPKYKRY